MPGPIVHITSGLGATLPLVWLSDGRFSAVHALCHGINSFTGPDVGVLLYLFCTTMGLPGLAGWLLALIHDPVLFPLTLGLPLAHFWSALSRRLAQRFPAAGPHLSLRQAFLLCAAGGLTHFSIDNVFEEDGQGHTLFLRWAIETGSFKPLAPLETTGVLVMGVILAFLLGGYAFVHWSSSPAAGSSSAAGAVVGRIRALLVSSASLAVLKSRGQFQA